MSAPPKESAASPPGYWPAETTGVLRPAVEAYLGGGELSLEHVAALRAYFRQWIMAPVWKGDAILEVLRSTVGELTDREDIDRWLKAAVAIGVDPL